MHDDEHRSTSPDPSHPAPNHAPALETDPLLPHANAPNAQRRSHMMLVIPMAIGIFLIALDTTIVVSSYAAIGSELNQLQNTSWIATAYMLTLTSFQPLYGKLSDIFGRKACLLCSYTIFAAGCLLCGLSRNMNELVGSRAFAGIGGGGMQTLVSIIMSDVVPLRSRGTWQGILNIIFAAGSAVGASLGGIFADTIGWRWTFLLQVPLALLGIVAVFISLHLPSHETADFATNIKRVDFAGAFSLVLTVFLLLLGLDRGGNMAWNDRWTVVALSLFSVFGLMFISIELQYAREPFAPKRIIANRAMIASYLVNLFGTACAFIILYSASLYFQAVLGKTASDASLWLIVSVAGAVLGSIGGGLMMQMTGKYYVLTVVAYVSMFFGTIVVLLATVPSLQSLIGTVIGLILISFGNGMGITTSLISVIANAGKADQAMATAVSYLFRSLGSVTGLSISSALVQGTLRESLKRSLSGNDADELIRRVRESLKYIDELDPATRGIVRASYGEAIRAAFYFSMAMAGLSMVWSFFIKEKPLPGRE